MQLPDCIEIRRSREVNMETQRNLACHACGVDLKDRAKDRRVLVSANDVLPLWTEILH